MSNTSRQASLPPSYPDTSQLQLGLDVFALIFGGLGNSLVITVVMNKHQKNVNDIFIMNLAIADFMFILLRIPGDVMEVMETTPILFYCSTNRPLLTMFFCLGLFTMTSMAIYRCYVIVNPYRPKMKIMYAYIWVLIVWILSFLSALPAIIVATVSRTGYCTGTWKSPKYKDAYIIFLLLAKCIIPLLLITIAYTRLGFFLYHSKPPQTEIGNRASMQKRNRIENLKIVKTIAAIVVLFAVCTTPHQTGWAMLQFGDREEKRKGKSLLQISPIIQNLHTCVNPLIYAISMTYYRQEYIKYLKKICCVCCCWNITGRVDPSACDDLIQQPNHSIHAQCHGSGEASGRNKVSLTTERHCDLKREETPSIEMMPVVGRRVSSFACEQIVNRV